MYRTALIQASSNRKTGPMPVTYTTADTCPDNCGLKNECYAKHGPTVMHWRKVTNGTAGLEFSEFLDKLERTLYPGMTWRHNVAGDLPGVNDEIDRSALMGIVNVNRKRKAKGFTYTHKPTLNHPNNRSAVAVSNDLGFTVNLSADNVNQADDLADLNIGPVVVVMPEDCSRTEKTPKGRTIVQCPATYNDTVNCQRCGICAHSGRKSIVGFPAHGTKKKALTKHLKVLNTGTGV